MRRAVVLPLTAALVAMGTVAIAVHGAAAADPPRTAPQRQSFVRTAGREATLRAQLRNALARHTPVAAHGTATVAVTGDARSVAAQARRLGGHVVRSGSGGVTGVAIAQSRVAQLAAAPGVGTVNAVVPARELDVTSEGVAASGADVWQNAGRTGTGVTIGIVDAGFAGLAAEVTAGRMPAAQTVTNVDDQCPASGSDVGSDQHGTAVAEIVHQMAPGATLALYCIGDNLGFWDAEQQIVQRGDISIVSSSLGFPGDSRGDGTGAAGTAAAAVKDARQNGILWIQSAGNSAADHWSGNLTDADRDGLIDLAGTGFDNESDSEFVYGSSDAYLELQWDAWPTSSADLTLDVFADQCTGAGTGESSCQTVTHLNNGDPVAQVTHPAGTSPYIEYHAVNTNAKPRIYYIAIEGTAYPSVHYDLTYEGAVGGSYLSCSPNAQDDCTNPARGYAGTVSSPASSPYALAVGAANVGDTHTAAGTLEYYSSRGPTIDGRTKPEITGWDGVSSNLSDFSGGFYGTSAAAPHVAGAAALVLAANPDLDAAQLQNFLERRANGGQPSTPANPASGSGTLTLGSATDPISPPAGADYEAITPTRVLDTRTTVGGHHARVPARGSVTLTIASLPADATAVAINLTGVNASASTFLSAYAGSSARPGTSNLNLRPPSDATAAVFAVVTVHNKAITIYNAAGTVDVVVDELGYFGTDAESGQYTAVSPNRVVNNHTTPAHGTVPVDPALPSGATAAVVNVTTAGAAGRGFVNAAPTCSTSSSTLNFSTFSRANLAIVQLDGNGHFCVANGPGTVRLFVDVVGYMGPTGAQYVALPAPQRIVDTRTGNGGNANGASPVAFVGTRTVGFWGSGIGDVPADARGLLTGVVEANNDSGGYLSMFPGLTRPATSTLNYSPGRVVANASIVGLSSNVFGVYASAGYTNAAVDLFGYFQPGPK